MGKNESEQSMHNEERWNTLMWIDCGVIWGHDEVLDHVTAKALVHNWPSLAVALGKAPYTLPGQPSRAGSGCRRAGLSPWQLWHWVSFPCACWDSAGELGTGKIVGWQSWPRPNPWLQVDSPQRLSYLWTVKSLDLQIQSSGSLCQRVTGYLRAVLVGEYPLLIV